MHEDLQDIKQVLAQVTPVGHATPIGHGRSRNAFLSRLHSRSRRYGKDLKFHSVLSNSLSSKHGFLETVSRCLAFEATSASLIFFYIQNAGSWRQVTIQKRLFPNSSSSTTFVIPYNAPGGTQKQVEDILRRLARLTMLQFSLRCAEDISSVQRDYQMAVEGHPPY